MAKQKQPFYKKVVISLFWISLLLIAVVGYFGFKAVYQSNVDLGERKSKIIYIPTGSNFDDVVRILGNENILKKRATFEFLARQKEYTENVYPGKFRILAKMSNNSLVNLLNNNIQEKIEIHYRGVRSKEDLIIRVCRRLEADSSTFRKALYNDVYLNKYGFTSENALAMFIRFSEPYNFYWNTSTDQFFDTVASHYKDFWTAERLAKVKKIGFSQTDATILATIVQGEQCCNNEEKKTIAGLYINRLNKRMKLQSDPTVIYAIGDFSIQRVSHKHTKFESPYNTYVNKGLPPGPIGFAKSSSIDAVLDHKTHKYIYMCAKEDFSGTHNFAKNFAQHKQFAKRYQRAMNQRGIH